MPNFLDITADDIAELNDEDLRTLIGLLCEADCRSEGFPTSGVIWGGKQEATDGGMDVVVRSDKALKLTGFIPRKTTVFQSKKNDMPKAKISKEMKPNGILREIINDLIKEKGAYIIVSSHGSTSPGTLENRKTAMKDAVKNHKNGHDLFFDFYDRGRIATWVRYHPSMILWVRNKIGRPLKGWQPYGNWSNTPGGKDETYLVDGALRLHDGTNSQNTDFPIIEGLQQLRESLSSPRKSIRLVGLSGVGKTRLVQALFDKRIGMQPLNNDHAYYTDMSHGPEPDPLAFSEQLKAMQTNAILIVDNCSSELHGNLTKACTGQKSKISILTVEYDVREDLPEETRVFKLEPASDEMIETLIKKRFPYIGKINAHTIASCSGGNARVALAIAHTVKRKESLAHLSDNDLFERLFWQKNAPDDSLLMSGEVCSLVYSFEGTDTLSEKSELNFLADFIGKSGAELYRSAALLIKRDLIQSRDKWRAVLPHAIANYLAKRALSSIPKDRLLKAFYSCESERLIKSFTRRLSFLHDCNDAINIIDDWLSSGGWIGVSQGNLNDFSIEIFKNIAPVSPEKALKFIERAANGTEGGWFTSRENSHYREFVIILCKIAYAPELFIRCVDILCRFALSEKTDENNNSTRDKLKSLFFLHLSGTHAPIELRANIIDNLVNSEDVNRQELGIVLLEATLKTDHFSSSDAFEFGARPRDYGYQPRTLEDQNHWFKTVIQLCNRLDSSNQTVTNKTRSLLARHFRVLWNRTGLYDVLSETSKLIHEKQPWNEGWIAVRSIIFFEKRKDNQEENKLLMELEKILKPIHLLERARAFAVLDSSEPIYLDDVDKKDATSCYRQAEKETAKIGIEVAQCIKTFSILLPDLVSTRNIRIENFGRGLAEGSKDKKKIWGMMHEQFKKTPVEERNIRIFSGFLASCADKDPIFYHSILDTLLKDNVLVEWFPEFQKISVCDPRDIKRLHIALDTGKIGIDKFATFAWGPSLKRIEAADLVGLLKRMADKENGIYVVIYLLGTLFHDSDKTNHSKQIIEFACEMLSIYPFSTADRKLIGFSYALEVVMNTCIKSSFDKSMATRICQNLSSAINQRQLAVSDCQNLFDILAQKQPEAFLDVFLEDFFSDYQSKWLFNGDIDDLNSPILKIPNHILLSWCDTAPEHRYPVIATIADIFFKGPNPDSALNITLICSLIEKAPDLKLVLKNIANTIQSIPMMWSDSLYIIFEKRSEIYNELEKHDNPTVKEWAKIQHQLIKKIIIEERKREEPNNFRPKESFE